MLNMKNRAGKLLIAAGIMTVFAIVYTILVCTVDVQPIGPSESRVGFAEANRWFAGRLPYNKFWYTITQALGAVALLTAAGFAAVGVLQLIQRKSLLQVDHTILALGMLFIAAIVLYFLFEKLALNYRPVDLGEGLEASYPSSHTLLVCCVMGGGMLAIDRVFASRKICVVFRIASAAVIVLMVAGRLLSGVHWFTDIVGGVLISSALVLFFAAFKAGQTG